MSNAAGVGRPKGKAKKTSDAERIRQVLNQYGVLFPTAKVKSVLRGRNRFSKSDDRRINLEGNAINVKIAQVRGNMVEELTGVRRKNRGRFTQTERELIEAKLALRAKEAEESPAVEEPVAEATAEAA